MCAPITFYTTFKNIKQRWLFAPPEGQGKQPPPYFMLLKYCKIGIGGCLSTQSLKKTLTQAGHF